MDEQHRKRKCYFRKTRKGKVNKFVNESHLQDNHCGYMVSQAGQGSTPITPSQLIEMISLAPHKQLIIIDTNIALHQIDVLEHDCPATSFIVLLQTVLQELRHLNLAAYRRVFALLRDENRSFIFYPNELSTETAISRKLNETVNDFNDRRIVEAAVFFQKSMTGADSECRVLVLTNDAANQRRARASGVEALGMRQYVSAFVTAYPELQDLVAADEVQYQQPLPAGQAPLFAAHLPLEQVLAGLRTRRLHRGTLHPAGDHWADCYVIVHGSGDEEGFTVSVCGEQHVNRATDGDVVAVELLEEEREGEKEGNEREEVKEEREEEGEGPGIMASTAPASLEAQEGLPSRAPRRRRGRVVGIIRRNWRPLAGRIDPLSARAAEGEADGAQLVQFRPAERRMPPVLLLTRRAAELADCLVVVGLDQWPVGAPQPLGHFVSLLGRAGDKQAETQLLLHEFGVPHGAFSAAVMACLPPAGWAITPEVAREGGRQDLRHLPVVSIDPPGCKDIDDALHCIRLPNGRLEAGVHIADVTYFVQPDTALDREAAARSTSTYLVDRRLDMLPGYLTTELCSLRSSEDHLAFSVIWQMDDQANILDVRFCKSVIRSVASLTYDEAQVMLDEPASAASSPLSSSVRLLNQLARLLRQRRIDTGALTLASPEVRFKLDADSQHPTDVCMYALKEANALVEEWMLLANITVAKKTLRHFPTLGVLRRHCPPSREMFAPLLAAAGAVGVQLDISSSKTLADSLDRAERPDDPYFNKLLRILSTRCMMPAQYFCSGEVPKDQFHHYGLAAPVYTHFTSPIRRYADVLVHRLLAAAIEVAPLPAANADRAKQREQCAHMNRRHRAAQHAQRASVNMHTIMFFRNSPCREPAYVLSVAADRFSVLIPRFGVEGPISLPGLCSALAKQQGQQVGFEVCAVAHSLQVFLQDSVKGKGKMLLQLQVFQKVQVFISVEGDGQGAGHLSIALVLHDTVLSG